MMVEVFAHTTRFAALDVPMVDPSGREVVVAIVKATYDLPIEGGLRRAEEPIPVFVNDVMTTDDDPKSSIKFANDAVVEKRAVDVLFVADAVSKKPVIAVDVAIRIGEKAIPIRVHGERVFVDGLLSPSIGPAAPFERMPIVWERAFGGATEDFAIVERRNPCGVGVAKRSADLVGTRAPQVEDPRKPHGSASDRHDPVGIGPIGAHWSQRTPFAGTFDERWMKLRMPLMPEDFDVRFFNVAPPEQVVDLQPGAVIAISGVSLEGAIRFEVPTLPVVFRARFDGAPSEETPARIDTIVVDANARKVTFTARRAVPQGRGRVVLRELRVDAVA